MKFNVVLAVALLGMSPINVFAQTVGNTCSSRGYTVATINGVFTDETEAIKNRDDLKYYFERNYNGESLTFDYLLNPSHLGGVGDILMSAYQKAFENETVEGYDLVEMLNDASQKVKTQKLLLVAHSQGNFYANSFYDTVAGQLGGVPKESISIYSVANPASRVAGGGKWLTSDTDKVISTFVASVPFKKIMPPNVHIELQPGDNFAGHGFSDVYLKYKSGDIVAGIQSSLDKLLSDAARREDSTCIDPPKLTIAHKVAGVALAVADPVATAGVKTAVATAKVGIFVVVTTVKAGVTATVWTYHTAVATAKWTYNTAVAVAVWGYDTSIAVAKTTWGMASTVGSFTYNVLTGALSNSQSANNNSASVILATLPTQELPVTNVTDNNAITIDATASVENQAGVADTQQQSQTVFVFEPKVQVGTNAPKLVFVGSFGVSTATQVMGTQSTTPVAQEIVIVEEEPADNAGSAMAVPALSAPQCSQTLATVGCLLATTTVHFEWSDVAGADHYLLNKNGEYSTTTEKSFDIEIKDFSDYIFEVVAVGVGGISSATSTQAVSVATIPIAINEIAWMGTKANTSDEWFEIKNNTGHTIDLSQWELSAKDGTPHVKLTGTIAPHAYLIFERTDDTAVKDVDMHQKFTGELENTGDQLTLSYASTTMDQTPAGAWPAGATSTRQTMERYSSREPGADPENWGTNLGYIKNGTDAKDNPIEGTPGEQNSVSTLINKGQDITSDFTLTADEEQYVVPNSVYITASSTLTIEPGVTISFYKEMYGHSNSRLIVEGAIVARGTSEDPITFNSYTEENSGVLWIKNGTGTSTFDNVLFENLEGSIYVKNGQLEVRNSEFINTDGGVDIFDDSTAIIENTNLFDLHADAFGVYGNSRMDVSSVVIKGISRGDAFGVYSSSSLTVASTTISGLESGDAFGVYLDSFLSVSSTTINEITKGDAFGAYRNSTLNIASTTVDGVHNGDGVGAYDSILNATNVSIKNVSGYGMFLAGATSTISNVKIENTGYIGIEVDGGTATITDTNVSGVDGWAGISVTNPTVPVLITGGEITGNNLFGISMDTGSAVLDGVSVHDNGSLDDNGVFVEENIVVWTSTE